MLGGIGLSVAIAGIGVGVAETVTASGGPSQATRPGYYCGAALAVATYRVHDTARRRALVERALELAPREVAPTLRTLRSSRPGSHRYHAAEQLFTYYNTNHCCQCLGVERPPTIQEVQRRRSRGD